MSRPIECAAVLFSLVFCNGFSAAATVYNIPPDAAPIAIAAGEIINLGVGGSLPPAYTMPAATTLNVEGGIYSPRPIGVPFTSSGNVNIYSTTDPNGPLTMIGGILNVYGGSLSAVSEDGKVNLFGGHFTYLLTGERDLPGASKFRMSGGSVESFDSPFRSEIEILGGAITTLAFPSHTKIIINGGMIGSLESAFASPVAMSAGSVDTASIASNTVMTVSGGSLGSTFEAFDNSELHLIGTRFELDGLPIAGLTFGESLVVHERNLDLDGVLLDGSSIHLHLSTDIDSGQFFSANSTLRLSLVPESSTLVFVVYAACAALAVRCRRAAINLDSTAINHTSIRVQR
ncbi:MAG TPA: hypothetical protein VGK58_17490 [Lacipirellulaceae bacterium]